LWVIFALLVPDSEYGSRSGSTDPIESVSKPDQDPKPWFTPDLGSDFFHPVSRVKKIPDWICIKELSTVYRILDPDPQHWFKLQTVNYTMSEVGFLVLCLYAYVFNRVADPDPDLDPH
jgi:hypothetical protein